MNDLVTIANSAVLVVGAVIGVLLWRSEKLVNLSQATASGASAEKSRAEAANLIKEASLALVAPLTEKINKLENEVRDLRLKVEQYIKDEAAYQAELHEKDQRIEQLLTKLNAAREERDSLASRLEHLEVACAEAGIDGYGEKNP